MKRICSTIILLLSVLTVFAQRELVDGVVVDKTAQKIVDAIARKINTDNPLEISFSMSVMDGNKQVNHQEGTLLSDGAKFHLSTKDYEDFCDGNNLWHFVKANNEVELSLLDKENNVFNLTQMIKTYAKDYRPKLIREEKRGNTVMNIIDLIPKGKSSIAKIRIASNKSTDRLGEMTIYIREGNTYIYKINKYNVNRSVKASDFMFPKEKYPSAEIIDLR